MMSLNKKTLEDVEVAGKRVLVRCDFNVPLKDGVISNDKRIKESLPTIKYLLENNARVILCSHLGRPKDGFDPACSLAPVAKRLEELLSVPVKMATDVVGESANALAKELKDGEVMLLENVRFEKGETKNNEELSKKFAELCDLFVNDAFGTAHRKHSSTAGVADYVPSVCGYLIKKEIEVMGGALQNPARPFVAILGGAKVSDKIGVIKNLLDKVDALIIGGGMAYTFQKALGGDIAKSICEEEKLDLARELVDEAKAKGVKLLLPIDAVLAKEFSADSEPVACESVNFPEGYMGMDIGAKTIELFAEEIKLAKTVIWNGPMGVFEFANFAKGTEGIAKAVAESDAVSIIGGGDSASAIVKMGFEKQMSHISTGGGASLEFLEGIELPGIACLDDK